MRCGTPEARQRVQVDRLEREIAWLREEIRIKDSRMASIPAAKRPHYDPRERLAVLELKAARNWSLAQTARAFLVSDETLAAWNRRLDEQGPDALVRTREPVNEFPDFVRYLVQRLQTLCPTLGKVKIAQILARAGLHLAASTVGRIRREPPVPAPTAEGTASSSSDAAAKTTSEATSREPAPKPAPRRINAKHPNHVWHVDLTTVSILGGTWTAWMPFALPQCFPFCWWLCVALDHYSRRIQGIRVFSKQPTAEQVKHFLGQVIAEVGDPPKHLITDQGVQFTSDAFQC